MTWYERFGFTKNPFSTDAFGAEYTLVNYSSLIEDLLYYTNSGSMIVLEGNKGMGKTMMLCQIINRFKGKGKVVYIDGDKIKKNIDIEKLLNKNGTGLVGNVMKSKPKGMIFLFDNVTKISKSNFEKIKYYFDQDYIKSVVFTIDNKEDLNLPASIQDRVNNRHIVIPPIINFDALRIIRERFSDHFFLPDSVVLELFELSNHNIKQLLENCEQVCAFVVNQGKGEVLPKYLKLIKEQQVEEMPKHENALKSKPIEVEN